MVPVHIVLPAAVREGVAAVQGGGRARHGTPSSVPAPDDPSVPEAPGSIAR